MPISNRNLQPGMTLSAKFKGSTYELAVKGEDPDNLSFEREDGTAFKSLSAAGSACMGGVACNGWRFWSVVGEEAPPPQPAAGEEVSAAAEGMPKTKAAKKPAAPKKKPLFKQVRKVINQNGLAEGESRWFCSACMKGFKVTDGAIPETCPQGHAREVEDELDSPMAAAVAASAD